MGKSAGPATGYMSPQAQQGGHYEGGFGQGGDRHYVPNTPGVYQQAAEAEAGANRPTQNTPFGSSSWQRDPATGAWTQNTSLAPGLQGAAQGMMGAARSAWGTPLDNGAQARQRAEDAIYSRATSRLDPYWQQMDQQQRAQLANQGLDPGSAAATSTRDEFGRARNDAYSAAMQQAIMGGGQEASRQQGMDIQSRMAPLQGLASLRGLLQMPGFMPGPNYLAAVQGENAYKLQESEQQNQILADIFGGLTQLGGKVIPAFAGAGAG